MWGEVYYLFYEKIHVQQKVPLFMGDSPSFFSKSGVQQSAGFWFSKLEEHRVLEFKGQSSQGKK
jgi:hypothetical protein